MEISAVRLVLWGRHRSVVHTNVKASGAHFFVFVRLQLLCCCGPAGISCAGFREARQIKAYRPLGQVHRRPVRVLLGAMVGISSSSGKFACITNFFVRQLAVVERKKPLVGSVEFVPRCTAGRRAGRGDARFNSVCLQLY